jgi:hypothetical protein
LWPSSARCSTAWTQRTSKSLSSCGEASLPFDYRARKLRAPNPSLGAKPGSQPSNRLSCRYAPGQQFKWHLDQVPPSLLDNGGQRLATTLV